MAIEDYAIGVPIGEVEEKTKLDRRILYRMIERALQAHPDGRPWGFRAVGRRPISWRGTLSQYAGRLSRLYSGKKEVTIYDYVDAQEPMLARMASKRAVGYQSLGYRESANETLPVKAAQQSLDLRRPENIGGKFDWGR